MNFIKKYKLKSKKSFKTVEIDELNNKKQPVSKTQSQSNTQEKELSVSKKSVVKSKTKSNNHQSTVNLKSNLIQNSNHDTAQDYQTSRDFEIQPQSSVTNVCSSRVRPQSAILINKANKDKIKSFDNLRFFRDKSITTVSHLLERTTSSKGQEGEIEKFRTIFELIIKKIKKRENLKLHLGGHKILLRFLGSKKTYQCCLQIKLRIVCKKPKPQTPVRIQKLL